MVDENDYGTFEIIPLSVRDRLAILAQESNVELATITKAYVQLLAGIDRNIEARFTSALQATTFQLQEYVKRNHVKPGKKAETDKHTPAQVRRAEMLFMRLVGEHRQG